MPSELVERRASAPVIAAISADRELGSPRGLGLVERELPTLFSALAGVVLLVNVVLTFWGAWTAGPTTDDPTHLMRLQSYIDTGWYLPTWQLQNGQPRPDVVVAYVYGPVTAIAGHVLAVLSGIEDLGHAIDPVESYEAISASASAYAARHIAVALIATLGLFAVAAIVRRILGSWRWGLLGAALLSAIPLWSGYAMINVKDTPVATGFSLVTLGLILLCTPGGIGQARLAAGGFAALSGGSVIAVGTRPGMWIILSASAALALALSGLLTWRILGSRLALYVSLARGCAVVFAAIVAYGALWVIYPRAFSTPLKLASESVRGSADYPPGDLMTLTAGIVHGQPPPWWYFPAWIGSQVPVGVLILSLAGMVAGLSWLIHLLRARRTPHVVGITAVVGVTLVAAQALIAPLAAFLLGSTVYSGLRQFLFIVPPYAVIATVGLWWILGVAQRSAKRRRLLVGAVLAFGGAALILPTVDQTRLFPYGYTYFNEIATMKPIDGRWQTDDWQVSVHELLTITDAHGTLDCYRSIPSEAEGGAGTLAFPSILVDGCGRALGIPYWGTRGIDRTGASPAPNEFELLGVNTFGVRVPDNCHIENTVRRPLRGQVVTLGWVARCSVPLPEYPPGGDVSFLDGASGEYLLKGWSPPEEFGSWSMGEHSTMGLRLPDGWRGRPLELTLDGFRPVPPGQTRSMRVSVNGHFVGEPEFTDSEQSVPVTVSIPAEVVDTENDGRLFITLENPEPVSPESMGSGADTRPLGFFLNNLRIQSATQ